MQPPIPTEGNEDKYREARERLLDEITAEARETEFWTGRETFSPAVMAAMATVPRHQFVPPDERWAAYANRPLPIGRGQTISQPYIVAVMTDLLDLGPKSRVLEIGTGCGYQAAVLAEIAGKVFSVETIAELADRAAARLKRLGYENVEFRTGNGWDGWPERGPYDGIIVTAAAGELPPALVEQLKPGGKLVVPIGEPYSRQILYRGVMGDDGTLGLQKTLPVAFVPLVNSKK